MTTWQNNTGKEDFLDKRPKIKLKGTQFVALIPAPLAMGTVLENGSSVKGWCRDPSV